MVLALNLLQLYPIILLYSNEVCQSIFRYAEYCFVGWMDKERKEALDKERKNE